MFVNLGNEDEYPIFIRFHLNIIHGGREKETNRNQSKPTFNILCVSILKSVDEELI